MVKKIINYILAKLHHNFPKAELYQEVVKQGLKEPCFIVKLLNIETTQLLGTRKELDLNFAITYLPNPKENLIDLYLIGEKLTHELEIIGEKGDLIRGRDIKINVVEDVLSIKVQYSLIVTYAELKCALMQELEIEW